MKISLLYMLFVLFAFPGLSFAAGGEGVITLGLNLIIYLLLGLFTLRLPLGIKYKIVLYVVMFLSLLVAWTWTGDMDFLENRIKISLIQALLPLVSWFLCVYVFKDKLELAR